MKKILYILIIAISLVSIGCKKDDIKPFLIENSSLYFSGPKTIFSLVGKNGDEYDLKVPVYLTGCLSEEERLISLKIQDSTAVQGRDYNVLNSKLDKGADIGYVVLRVKKLAPGVTRLSTRLTLVPNHDFRGGMNMGANVQSTLVTWTEEYTRPDVPSWRYWFLFICKGYSRNFHKIMVDEFGTDIDHYTNSVGAVKKNPEYIYKSASWWFSASRSIRETVKAHDASHPDSPMMHSDDYEEYSHYNVAVGKGNKPNNIPTILETLNVM